MCIELHVKYPLLLSNFNQNLNFLDMFSKNAKTSNFMKNLPAGAEFFSMRTKQQADMTHLIVT